MDNKNLGVLGRTTKVLLNTDTSKLAVRYKGHLEFLEIHHGRKFMIDRAKAYLTIAERYSLMQYFEPLRFVKSDKNGFPSKIHYFKRYLRGDINQRSAALSVLRIVEDMRLPISKI